jgi:hypothetical protein
VAGPFLEIFRGRSLDHYLLHADFRYPQDPDDSVADPAAVNVAADEVSEVVLGSVLDRGGDRVAASQRPGAVSDQCDAGDRQRSDEGSHQAYRLGLDQVQLSTRG